MIRIIKKRNRNISIPIFFKKTSIFNKVVSVTDVDLKLNGNIVVSPDIDGFVDSDAEDIILDDSEILVASWSLYNLDKNIKIMDGEGKKTIPNLQPGVYSIEYYPIEGYITPNPEIKYLPENKTIEFVSEYKRGESITGLSTGYFAVTMNTIIGGWRVERINDDDEVLFSIPSSGFNNTMKFQSQNLPFGRYRLVIKDLDVNIISPPVSEYIQEMSSSNNRLLWNIVYDTNETSETTVSVNISTGDSVVWRLEPKNREQSPIIRNSSIFNYPISLQQSEEIWKFSIIDENDLYVDKYIKINGKLVLKNIQNNTYDYEMLFADNENNSIMVEIIDIGSELFNDVSILYGYYKRKGDPNYITSSPFYATLDANVYMYGSIEDDEPNLSNRIISGVSPGTFFSPTTFYPVPTNLNEKGYSIGYYEIKVNKSSIITIYKKDESGNYVEIYSTNTGKFQTDRIFLDANDYRDIAIDITEE